MVIVESFYNLLRWVAKLAAHLLAKTAQIQTYLKNKKNGRHKQNQCGMVGILFLPVWVCFYPILTVRNYCNPGMVLILFLPVWDGFNTISTSVGLL
jgi:hypothetical protein